jgi:hypothetical protein
LWVCRAFQAIFEAEIVDNFRAGAGALSRTRPWMAIAATAAMHGVYSDDPLRADDERIACSQARNRPLTAGGGLYLGRADRQLLPLAQRDWPTLDSSSVAAHGCKLRPP